MAHPTRIWLEISHHAAFRAGGWAWVRADGPGVSGHAGGEKLIDAERAALAAFIAALAQPAGPRQLHTSSEPLAAIPARIRSAQAGEDPPTENLDLWAQASAALASAPLTIVQAARTPGSPAAFAAAWADLARDKAKAKGRFLAPIPKVNLAKAGVPAVAG